MTKKEYKQLLLDHFTERLNKLTAKELKELAAKHMTDYVCIATWDPIFDMMRYHWVHKSEKDPVQFVKSLNPEQEVL